uniref:AEC family transporter n=1 Tax=Streptococcus pluranimalium TaxID=82348 RepID=UPI003F69036A
MVIFSNLAATTPNQVLLVILPLIVFMVLGVLGIILVGFLAAKIFKMSPYLAISLGISCTFGFPTTMFLPKEVAQSIGQNTDEKVGIENYLLPKMLVAGLVMVTISSVILAGIAVNHLV